MRIRFPILSVAVLLARIAGAQSPAQHPAATTPVGIWRGTSVCLVRQSACKDEFVVYRITKTNAADSVMLDAGKIVRGEEQDMGALACQIASPAGSLTCVIPQGTWHFRVRADSLVGELRLPDNTKFRDVRASRALR